MPRKKIDATIDGARIKVIFEANANGSQWLAKPKDHDVGTLHFHQDANGLLEVHQDSSDGRLYRKMIPETICSGSYPAGRSWIEKHGDKGLAVLPMETSADGFRILATPSGSSLWLPADNWCLMAVGPWGPWTPKKS